MSYLDTSILMAYYCPEALSKKVQNALSKIDAPTISPLVETEMVSSLALKIRTGEMEESVAVTVRQALEQDIAAKRYCRIAMEHRYFTRASEWIGEFRMPLRTMDALHLAAADAHDLILVTAEKQLSLCAKHFKVACKWVH